MNADDYMNALVKTIMETVDKFAPEKRVENNKHFVETWITYEIKNAIVKRNSLFEKWIQNPTKRNRERYKTARNNVTNLIRKEKRNENFEKRGKSNTQTNLQNVKNEENQAQNTNNLPDTQILNNYFFSVVLSL